MPEISVVDLGCGNLGSVINALRACGFGAKVAQKPEEIERSDRLLLPGVGSFSSAISYLRASGMDDAISESVRRGGKLLGICLGMQILSTSGSERGSVGGLNLIPGRVIPVSKLTGYRIGLPVSHVGWTTLTPNELSPLEPTQVSDEYYFTHAYAVIPDKQEVVLYHAMYESIAIPAVISSGNILGVQFHPEKSGESGLSFLQRFFR